MELANLLTPLRTRALARVSSKKTCLELVASLASDDLEIDEPLLFRALFERERLGSTALGNGIAIPHCRVPGCSQIAGILITIEEPIDFDAPDNQPVDLVCALVVPEEATNDHLSALAEIASRFSQPSFVAALRATRNDDELYSHATQ